MALFIKAAEGPERPPFLIVRLTMQNPARRLKRELGLDHFEGRSWTGLHRHALMTLIAFAFLQRLRLEQAGRRGEKRIRGQGPPPQPTLPAVRRALVARLVRAAAAHCPRCGACLGPPLPPNLPK